MYEMERAVYVKGGFTMRIDDENKVVWCSEELLNWHSRKVSRATAYYAVADAIDTYVGNQEFKDMFSGSKEFEMYLIAILNHYTFKLEEQLAEMNAQFVDKFITVFRDAFKEGKDITYDDYRNPEISFEFKLINDVLYLADSRVSDHDTSYTKFDVLDLLQPGLWAIDGTVML